MACKLDPYLVPQYIAVISACPRAAWSAGQDPMPFPSGGPAL
jgi:hypothetical protein